jgi:hypothetical protein
MYSTVCSMNRKVDMAFSNFKTCPTNRCPTVLINFMGVEACAYQAEEVYMERKRLDLAIPKTDFNKIGEGLHQPTT